MTLGEKIAALRGERKLSQGDLAEQLDVSRQSVSKWETGQAVPELDKIIKLADVFGVSVDELVRDGEIPKPEAVKAEAAPAAEPEPKIVYVERRLSGIQILGVAVPVLGLLSVILGVAVRSNTVTVIGAAMVVLGLPLLLAKKHPVLIDLWLLWAAASLIFCNPWITGIRWNPFYGFVVWWKWVTNAEEYIGGDPRVLLLAFVYLAQSVLMLALPLYTGRLWWKSRKARKKAGEEAAA